ncbi:HNH endonuclease signature motif containing protein [Cryobacterium tagatosivorans]|uniref:HNH endonuclease n=1 Tax=Cryobacterium tagatosivorans TaxID=1259199 RepID=A0A4R8UFJ4_9MICO|nr:HNH endonuclease signature motif containing protein [Cryobacterium tagatosivorans]TFB49519.1 HNH endonuclease [Cryobacterium tagatosivorans]
MKLQGPEEPRTLTQLRADVFRDLLLDTGCGEAGWTGAGCTETAGGLRPNLLVTVPMLTLLGVTEEPGNLDGYGPIDPDTARALAAKCPSCVRILTHPETGAVLSVGRDRYTIPGSLRTMLQVRDGTCRHPGCSRAASRSDIDHGLDWAFGGRTDHNNLAHLCPASHALKHEAGWKVSQATDGTGTLTWTTPTGHTYVTEPETLIGTAISAGLRKEINPADGPACEE